MSLRALLACLLASLLVAAPGCADDPGKDEGPADPEPAQDDNATATPPQVTRGEGRVTASGGPLTVGSGGTPFQVSENATLIFAELAWDDEVNDLNLQLSSPDAGETGSARNYDHSAAGGAPGSPDSPHSLTISGDALKPGEWLMSAAANGAGGNVAFRVVATVFYGETEVPEGYSAL